jgi:uncharacterized damage-inducible protein DinB
MSSGLADPLRHNSWATRQLLAFCGALTPEQLEVSAEGTYGSILATLRHLVGAERRYRMRLAGETPEPVDPTATAGLDDLDRMMEQLSRSWDEMAAGEFAPDRVLSWTSTVSGARQEAAAGLLVAQALNHGNEHRAQIYTVLTTIGVEPPDLDAWSYGLATGRFRETPAE